MSSESNLAIRNLGRTFYKNTPNQRIALDRVNLTLHAGDFATVIGGNGAGKSTLLNAIAGEVFMSRASTSRGCPPMNELPGYPEYFRTHTLVLQAL